MDTSIKPLPRIIIHWTRGNVLSPDLLVNLLEIFFAVLHSWLNRWAIVMPVSWADLKNHSKTNLVKGNTQSLTSPCFSTNWNAFSTRSASSTERPTGRSLHTV